MKNFHHAVSAFGISVAFVFFFSNYLQAQVDTTKKKDTTLSPAAAASTAPAPAAEPAKKSIFIAYAGPNISTLNVESNELDKESKTGWHVGISWRKGGFFYTQVGLRYNSPTYSVFPKGVTSTGDHKFTVSDIDVPINVGLNFLEGRAFGLRGFLGAVPAFNLSVGDNDYHISKDSVNTFIFYGQIGVGVDFLFLAIDLGYNYGFSDLIKNRKSKPGQAFLNVGFKF